jgi:hypothetical protein
MLASDYARTDAKKKGAGLHYSTFQKRAASWATTYKINAPKNRHFHSRIAEVGLKAESNEREFEINRARLGL